MNDTGQSLMMTLLSDETFNMFNNLNMMHYCDKQTTKLL